MKYFLIFDYILKFLISKPCFLSFSKQSHAESFRNFVKNLILEPKHAKIRVLLHICLFWVQKGFFEEISRSLCIIFGQETHEHVKTIKKNVVWRQKIKFFVNMHLNIGMFSRRGCLPGLRRPIEGCFV